MARSRLGLRGHWMSLLFRRNQPGWLAKPMQCGGDGTGEGCAFSPFAGSDALSSSEQPICMQKVRMDAIGVISCGCALPVLSACDRFCSYLTLEGNGDEIS